MSLTHDIADIRWNDGNRNGVSLAGYLDEFDTDATIARLERAAGVKGEWDYDPDVLQHNWWGLHGTFRGVVFIVYTWKTGRIKIGTHAGSGLDIDDLRAALLAIN